jgi:hypothetical protein
LSDPTPFLLKFVALLWLRCGNGNSEQLDAYTSRRIAKKTKSKAREINISEQTPFVHLLDFICAYHSWYEGAFLWVKSHCLSALRAVNNN